MGKANIVMQYTQESKRERERESSEFTKWTNVDAKCIQNGMHI